MFGPLKRHWRELKSGAPGERFQRLCRRRRERPSAQWKRVLMFTLGAAVFAAGVIMLAIPGPGLLAMLVGAGLMAVESSRTAKVLDWVELRLRPGIDWGERQWRRVRSSFLRPNQPIP